MNREELQQAITETLAEIEQVKLAIEEATDPREAKKMLVKLKELQYLQLWHIEQIEHQKD